MLDMKNAFNESDRSSYLRRLTKNCRLGQNGATVLTSLWQSLYFFHCWSSTGDPMGPLLFSLVILEALDDIGHIDGLFLQL